MNRPLYLLPSRRQMVLALATVGMLPVAARRVGAMQMAQSAPVRVVVELFTSQGCSACPPADRLLGKLCQMPGVLGVSYNVDIWDYLGWRDTLARPEFTRRHHLYARAWGQESVYTPQMVVNGRRCPTDKVPEKVRALLRNGDGAEGGLRVPLRLHRREKALRIEVGAAPEPWRDVNATLWLVTIKRHHRQRIRRGENAGREIVYHHVARSIAPAGMWHGEAMELALPHEHVMGEESDLCVALLQLQGHGPIMGAAAL